MTRKQAEVLRSLARGRHVSGGEVRVVRTLEAMGFAKHHHCGECFSDPMDALNDVLALLEEPASDATERRLQREAIEHIAEDLTGRHPNLAGVRS